MDIRETLRPESVDATDCVICSDGGCSHAGKSATACIVFHSSGRGRVKLAAYLGDATSYEAEVFGGLLGLSYLKALNSGQVSKVVWCSDHEGIVSCANGAASNWATKGWINSAGRGIASQGMWKEFLRLSEGLLVSGVVAADRLDLKAVRSCHRACKWVQKIGEKKLKESGEGELGTRVNANSPWFLFDGRTTLCALRAGVECNNSLATLFQSSAFLSSFAHLG